MPPETVKVDRTGKWGNPYRADAFGCPLDMVKGSHEAADYRQSQAVKAFKNMIRHQFRRYPSHAEIVAELRGKNLACWCRPGTPCHADVLLEIANADGGAA